MSGAGFRSVFMALSFLTAWLTGCAAPQMGDNPAAFRAPSRPNWALAASEGVATAAEPTRRVAAFAVPPAALLDALDAVAAVEPRVERLDDGSDPTYRAYIQRSALMRYPDVVSARAVALEPNKTGLLLLSRSVYGYSDLGVNRQRVDRWLASLAERL